MLTDKSPVKPNTIHMNTVLKMCAKANDMDALFSIAAHLPSQGIRAPNNLTYTIILNAIRMHAFNSLRGDLSPMQQRAIRQQANLDARLLWEGATKRWRQGTILIDEELVCAMGRVLLLGVEKDVDDIMSLVEQTMNIPRQAPRLGSAELQKIDPGSQGELGAPQHDTREVAPPENEAEITSDELSVTTVNPFETPSSGVTAYVKPGQNTLSLLMEAFLDLPTKEPATKYWNIITKDMGVEPDAVNYHAYLRVLRVSRASTKTVDLLVKMPKSYFGVKTFRIAMSTCLRDKLNRHAFSNSGKILDLMQTTLEVPDINALYTYLDVAFTSTVHTSKMNADGKNEPSKSDQGKQILRALERINPSYVNLRSVLAYGDPTRRPRTPEQRAELTNTVLQLTQKMVSAHDLLMNKALVDRGMYPDLMKQRSKLAAFITRYRGSKNTKSINSVPNDSYARTGLSPLPSKTAHAA